MNKRFVPNDKAWVQEHYESQNHLAIRIQTHKRYTLPKIEFSDWVLDQLPWAGTETVLDVGCGSGFYLTPALNRCRRYMGGDISLGMIQELPHGVYDRLVLDAVSLPFGRESVEVILANHMLYHVPDLPAAINQFKRILRPGGWLVAATNSSENMLELRELFEAGARYFGANVNLSQSSSDFTWPFTLENGGSILGNVFGDVQRHDLISALVFPVTTPAIDYIDSIRDIYLPFLPPGIPWSKFLDRLRKQVDSIIADAGEFRVRKHGGVYICQR